MGRQDVLTGSRAPLVAEVLSGAWRVSPPTLDLTPGRFHDAAEYCRGSGTAPLLWWRARNTDLREAPDAGRIHNSYRLSSVRAAVHRQTLARVIPALREGGVEPVLVKGWAAAHAYPEEGLRGYTDHDICVRERDAAGARRVLGALGDIGCTIDLHVGFGTLDEEPEDDLMTRSVLADCGGTPVRLLAPEDHLRVLCRHFLRHGGARPLWLCDIAVAVESRAPGFDWDRCLGPKRRVANWVLSTLGLAQELLGMSRQGTPLEHQAARPPRWMVTSVLDAWDRDHGPILRISDGLLASASFKQLRKHWPNGLQATVAVRGPINGMPRLPFQLAACVPGAVRVATGVIQRWQSRPRSRYGAGPTSAVW